MRGKPKRQTRQKNLTERYLSGDTDEGMDRKRQIFSNRSASSQQRKMERTALLRAAETQGPEADIDLLPVARVVQAFGLYFDLEPLPPTEDAAPRLAVLRKTLAKLLDTQLVVGDLVRFRDTGIKDERGRPEAVIERLLPRNTLLTRSDSFKAIDQHPIVANADQMLIVASIREPEVRWGLIDRMLVAAQGGGLNPVICVNKYDLAAGHEGDEDIVETERVLGHYESMGLVTLRTSIEQPQTLERLRAILKDKTTVLAGHSGVGKSSLIRAIQPQFDLRVAAISGYTGKGRHTTTSARRYLLDFGGYVVDTPGVKLFGLWNISRENLGQFFADVESGTAPDFRRESYQRILESLPRPEAWQT